MQHVRHAVGRPILFDLGNPVARLCIGRTNQSLAGCVPFGCAIGYTASEAKRRILACAQQLLDEQPPSDKKSPRSDGEPVVGGFCLQGLRGSAGAASVEQRVEARRAVAARLAHHLPELRRARLLRARHPDGAHHHDVVRHRSSEVQEDLFSREFDEEIPPRRRGQPSTSLAALRPTARTQEREIQEAH